jgi:hypothetical protein
LVTALLPVYEGNAPPENVDIAYGLVCGLFLGLAVALIAQRCLWPSTAMQIFTQRAAAQLDLCSRALAEGGRDSKAAARSQDAADLVSTYAKQLSLLGQLHAQAHAESVEQALDDTRRASLLALIQALFDASLRAPRWRGGNEMSVPPEAEPALTPLLESLAQRDAVLVARLKATADALRGHVPEPGSSFDTSLAEARAAVGVQVDALRGRADLSHEIDTSAAAEFLAQLAASDRLVESQLKLEAWLADWHRAQGGQPDAARTSAAAPTRHPAG